MYFKFLLISILALDGCAYRNLQQNYDEGDAMQDSICRLRMSDKESFLRYLNGEMMRPVSELKQFGLKLDYAVYYCSMSKQSGEYEGIFISLDSLYNKQHIYRFHSQKVGVKLKEIENLLLGKYQYATLFNDEYYYCNFAYVSDGGYVALCSFRKDTLINGLLYSGCMTTNVRRETNVEDPRHVELLKFIIPRWASATW